MIEIENLTFTYPYEEKPTLKSIDLEINKGELFCLVGTSGCGKSTLCMCLNGLIPHSISGKLEGNVIVNGINTKEKAIAELAQNVGMVFQNPESQLFALCVEDELRFGPENLALPEEEIIRRVKSTLKLLKIENIKNKSPEQLSSGQKQKVAIAATLVMQPKILVLDEPTANLDPSSSEEIFKIIFDLKKKGMTIFLAEHDVERVTRFADRVAVMHNGRIVLLGKPREVMSSDEIVKYIYPPKICTIAKKLKRKFEPFPLTPEELAKKIKLRRKLQISEKKKIETKPIVEIKNLNYWYEKEEHVLHDVNLTINEGEFLAIVGPNGAGKSTLVLQFNGLLKPSKGEVFVGNISTKKGKVSDLAKKVGYVFQNPDAQMFEDDVEKEIAFGPSNLGLGKKEIKKRVEEAIKYCGLENVRRKDPFSLSVGQKRRVTIASILAMKPQVIIVDEPTTGLDSKTAEKMMNLIKKLNNDGHTIILVTHDMEIVADYADRIIVIADGRMIFDGSARQLFAMKDMVHRANLIKPEINRLGHLIGEPNLFRLEEALEVLK